MIDFGSFKIKYIYPYEDVDHIYDTDIGYIVWRRGTGDNIELLHIKVWETGKGNGTKMLRKMTKALEKDPPYHSVFAFCLGSNDDAHKTYKQWGFKLTRFSGLYRDDDTVICTIPFSKLKEI